MSPRTAWWVRSVTLHFAFFHVLYFAYWVLTSSDQDGISTLPAALLAGLFVIVAVVSFIAGRLLEIHREAVRIESLK